MAYSPITFVSAFIVPPKMGSYINIDKYIYNFKILASSGIPICLFTSSELQSYIPEIQKEFPNVKFLGIINYNELWTTQYLLKYPNIGLPATDNPDKDSHEFMNIMNSKLSIMRRAIELNPFNSNHFGWIDFGILKLSKKLGTTLAYLNILSSKYTTFDKKILFISSGMPKCQDVEILKHVYWRFLGGFFMGDSESICEFDSISQQYYKLFIEKYSINIWEINLWAWMEMLGAINPCVNISGFDDSVLFVPPSFHTLIPLSKTPSISIPQIQYKYFFGTEFHPSSASFIRYNNKNILNMRYLNYWIRPSEYFTVENSRDFIISKNAMIELNSDFHPISCSEVSEKKLPPQDTRYLSIQGIEDCRLFEYENHLRFIGTNYDRISTGKLRIVMGTYETNPPSFQDFQILEPPTDTNCEKNWIPFVKGTNLYFIYKWFPLQIGTLRGNHLNIIYNQTMPLLFENIRGSSLFIQNSPTTRLCVVHYCNYRTYNKKTYLHLLVEFEEKEQSFKPIRYSKPFCFDDIGVEYCIGFEINHERYLFWISRKDRNPMFLSVPVSSIELETIPSTII